MATLNLILHGAVGIYRRNDHIMTLVPAVKQHKKAYGTWADVWNSSGALTEFEEGKSYFFPRAPLKPGSRKPEFQDGGIPLFQAPAELKPDQAGVYCKLFLPHPSQDIASFRFSRYDQPIFEAVPPTQSHLNKPMSLAHVHVLTYEAPGIPEMRVVDGLQWNRPPRDQEGKRVWSVKPEGQSINFHVFSEPGELVSRDDHGGALHLSHHNALENLIGLWNGMGKLKLAPVVFRPTTEQDDPYEAWNNRAHDVAGMAALDLRSLWEMFPRTGTVGGGSCSGCGC